jgi:hypothetical protein
MRLAPPDAFGANDCILLAVAPKSARKMPPVLAFQTKHAILLLFSGLVVLLIGKSPIMLQRS